MTWSRGPGVWPVRLKKPPIAPYYRLQTAGFVDIEIEVTRRSSLDEIASSGASASIAALFGRECNEANGKCVSAFVRVRKPEKQKA